MKNYQSQVYVDTLGIDPHQSTHVVMCPFHADSRGASFSVDLDKGLFYCFGACEEPKGGGAIAYVIKWQRIREGKTITRDEARKYINRVFRTPDASTLLRLRREEEVRQCMRGSHARAQRTLREIDMHAAYWSFEDRNADTTWDALAEVYRDAALIEGIADAFGQHRSQITPDVLAFYAEVVARGWWTPEHRLGSPQHSLLSDAEWKALPPDVELAHRVALSGAQWETLLHEGLMFALAEVTRAYEAQKGSLCPGDDSNPKRPKPTPVKPRRTPVR